jgi:hypothetical protein
MNAKINPMLRYSLLSKKNHSKLKTPNPVYEKESPNFAQLGAWPLLPGDRT